MKKTSPRRTFFVLASVFVAFGLFSVFIEATQAAPRRTIRRRPAAAVAPKAEPSTAPVRQQSDSKTFVPGPSERTKAAVPKAVLTAIDLNELCAKIKADAKAPTETVEAQCKERLLRSAALLSRTMAADSNREAAVFWRKSLKLDELSATLQAEAGPDDAVLAEVWNAFHADKSGVKWLVFEDVRKELRRFRTIRAALKAESYEKQLVNVCDHLSEYIDEYSRNTDPGYGIALSDVATWLEDVSIVEPRTAQLAAATLARLSETNLRFYVSRDFIAAGFQNDLEETVEVNDNILGTRVVGSGTITGTSTAELVPNKNAAELMIVVDASVQTKTTGHHHPVRLDTHTSGTMRGEKSVRITPERITTSPARTQARLQSTISNVRINGGPLVQNVARGQIEQKRGASQAEARRRAERQMNARIDERVDPRVAELNDNYQSKFREPLVKTGLFPRIWEIFSSERSLDGNILVGDDTQPAAAVPGPKPERDYDLFIQVHQSALNNAAAIALSGRAYDEEKVLADLEAQFKELPKALQREEGQKPIHVTFAQKAPIAVSFVDNRIKAVFRIDSFIQEGTSYPGLDVTLLYDVKTATKKGDDGKERTLVVLEQAEPPQAFPRGFDPKSNQRISARHQAIRTIVLRRLETLPKTVESQARELKGEWEGDGTIVPVFASANDGWLTFAWDWVPTKK